MEHYFDLNVIQVMNITGTQILVKFHQVLFMICIIEQN